MVEQQVLDIWDMYDKDQSGVLTPEQAKEFLIKLSESNKDVGKIEKKIYQLIQADPEGKLKKDDMMKLLK